MQGKPKTCLAPEALKAKEVVWPLANRAGASTRTVLQGYRGPDMNDEVAIQAGAISGICCCI